MEAANDSSREGRGAPASLLTRPSARIARKTLLLSAATLLAMGVMSMANEAEASYGDKICQIETTSCDYSKVNPHSSATGKYQMTQAALIDVGIISKPDPNSKPHKGAGEWDNVVWNEDWGVSSREEFLNNPAAQEKAFEAYSRQNWQSLEAMGTTDYIGAVYHGHIIDEAGLLAAAHFLGPKGLDDYLRYGEINEQTLKNHPNIEEEIIKRLQMVGGEDISDITGESGPGAFAGQDVSRGGIALADAQSCDPEVEAALRDASIAAVNTAAILASHEGVGYSTMDEPFGFLSCLEDLLSGGVDATFTPPTLSDILGMLENYICQKAEEMYNMATAEVNSVLSEATGAANERLGGFSAVPIVGDIVGSNASVNIRWDRNKQGSIPERFDYGINARNPNDPYGIETNKNKLEEVQQLLHDIEDWGQGLQ